MFLRDSISSAHSRLSVTLRTLIDRRQPTMHIQTSPGESVGFLPLAVVNLSVGCWPSVGNVLADTGPIS